MTRREPKPARQCAATTYGDGSWFCPDCERAGGKRDDPAEVCPIAKDNDTSED